MLVCHSGVKACLRSSRRDYLRLQPCPCCLFYLTSSTLHKHLKFLGLVYHSNIFCHPKSLSPLILSCFSVEFYVVVLFSSSLSSSSLSFPSSPSPLFKLFMEIFKNFKNCLTGFFLSRSYLIFSLWLPAPLVPSSHMGTLVQS